ncbi:efflux RND transporter permease subunit [Pseudomonas sp. ICBG1301]|uniref:efflux RND transporter permease subunit n=1 Tax=Pseudomonas sp. ICBG1301 TaxID=2795987 RepID=UPI001964964B|nr:efflux RND transporter permease subunit [Pseudomonas sp. ICBG1301]MBM9488496.1 efflux RND transporter permease subunit [Pseudomonas sp. ICBG1301]
MNLSTWSIRSPIPSILLFLILSIAGLYAFHRMKVQNFPDMDLPTVSVSAALPGAAPPQLETEVARKLEDSISSVQGLKNLRSTIQDGMVSISAEFRLEKPVQEAVDDVRSAVQRVRADLPTDLRDPIVSKLNIIGSPILAFSISSSDMDESDLSWYVDNTLSRNLRGIRGVGSVTRVGGLAREIQVELDPLKLEAIGVTAAEISQQLRNVQTDATGGLVDLGHSKQPLRLMARVKSADELTAVELSAPGGQHFRLGEVASIKDTVAERNSLALLDGKPVVGFEIARAKGAGEVEVGNGVQQAIAQLRRERPDLQITQVFDFVQTAQDEFDASMSILYEGALLAILIVFLFLRDVRATLISAAALPLSVLPAFIVMDMMGFSLNAVTLLALSLVIGLLVDDAIVEVENIERHITLGKTPLQAAKDAASEIGLAVVATTFALIAVFLPTAFMDGIAGRFFKQFGWTAALAVFASLVVARLLTPMMAAYLMKAHSRPRSDPFWMPAYLRISQWALGHRWITLFMAGGFFVGSLMLIPLLPQGFFPPDDNSQTQVTLELPPGATLAQTQEKAEDARRRLETLPHVQRIFTTIGGGSAGSTSGEESKPEMRVAMLTVLLDPRKERPKKSVIEDQIRTQMAELAGVRSKVGFGNSGEKYQLVLAGDDPRLLAEAADAVQQDLRNLPGLGNISSNTGLVRNEIILRPDFAKAAELGVTGTAIADTLRVATVGDYDQLLAKLNLEQRQIPIVVKLSRDVREDMRLLERLTVRGAKGPVLLNQVVQLEQNGGPARLSRINRARSVIIDVELSGMPLGDLTAQVATLPSIRHLPGGVHQVTQGDEEMMRELFTGFGVAMFSGVLAIYVVLVLLFKDFFQPVTILAALPLSLGGAFVGLLLAGQAFSLSSLIGLVMLMGIATKNSILLVDYAIEARRGHPGPDGVATEQPMGRTEALIDACHKRARPVIMTTLAMGAGMLPVALGLGSADPSFRSPMAAAVIGGLITSTVLSLLVIPAVYTIIDDLQSWLRKLPNIIGNEKFSFKKKAGFGLLGLVFIYWLAFPIIPFLEIPNKIAVMSVLVVIGEVLFLIAIALLGKEYWEQIKQWTLFKLRKRKH